MFNRNRSYASAAGGTRPAQQPLLSRKKPHVQITSDYQKLVETLVLKSYSNHARPRSQAENGIRIYYGESDMMLLSQMEEAISVCFPDAVGAHMRPDKGYVDLDFLSANEADRAAQSGITHNDRAIRVGRTRYFEESGIYISFDRLPTNFKRKDIIKEIEEGLMSYGTVEEVGMYLNPLGKNLSHPKGYAIIHPLSNISEDINLIPRKAYITINDKKSRPFVIHPEKAPPICSNCQYIGHRVNKCPSTKEGLKKHLDEFEDHCGMEEVNGETLLNYETPEEETKLNNERIFEWGEHASYETIKPISAKQRKAIRLAQKELTIKNTSPTQLETQPGTEHEAELEAEHTQKLDNPNIHHFEFESVMTKLSNEETNTDISTSEFNDNPNVNFNKYYNDNRTNSSNSSHRELNDNSARFSSPGDYTLDEINNTIYKRHYNTNKHSNNNNDQQIENNFPPSVKIFYSPSLESPIRDTEPASNSHSALDH